ncbi:MAG: ATP-binding protein, partial [Planctomycetota bacterium]
WLPCLYPSILCLMLAGYRPRELARLVSRALETMPVVVVTGLRQSGKTTFLQNDPAIRGRRFLSLDGFADLETARRDPDALLEGDEPMTIDEAQRCPEILMSIKRAVDRRRRPGQFLLSGSASFDALKGVSESLAGRALHLTLHPFTLRERNRLLRRVPFLVSFLERPELPEARETPGLAIHDMLLGGMPAVAVQKGDRDLWFKGYEQTYLERDVRSLSRISDLIAFRSFLRLAGLRTAQLLNQSALARDARISAATATSWMSVLEASFVVERLPPYLRSRTTRLIRSPKLFLSDSALAAHLCDVEDFDSDVDRRLSGALFETFVAQNLRSILQAWLPNAALSFWNVQGRHEVDFVIESGRRLLALELKSAAHFDDRDLGGLRAFLAKTPEARAGVLLYNGRSQAALGDRLFAIPVVRFLG